MLINCWMGEEREVKERCYCERKVKILLIDARCFFPTSHTTHNTHTHTTHTHTQHTHTHSGNRQLGSPKASGIGEEPEPVSIMHPQVCTPTFMCTFLQV